jgi:hypothetical protein
LQKSKYDGISLPDLSRVKELEAENGKIKYLYVELAVKERAVPKALSPSAKLVVVDVMVTEC